MTPAYRDIVIGSAALLFALSGWFIIIPSGVDVPDSVEILALSPDFWPRIIMILLGLSGAVILGQGILKRHQSSSEQDAPDPGDNVDGVEIVYKSPTNQLLWIVLVFAFLFAFYFTLPSIGMVAGAILLVFLGTLTLGTKSWIKSLCLSLALPFILYFFFTQIASVPIPLGWFEALR